MKNNIGKTIILTLPVLMLLASFWIIPSVSATAPLRPITTLEGVVGMLEKVLAWAQIILFAVAGIFIIIAAFTYLTAAGDDEKLKKAKQQIVYAIVALVIGLLAAGVSLIIKQFFGIAV